ncbi:MAG: hypothetical protein PHY47_12760 [Lachnospiraceae bacterium]|nr:hypothetical protein [Lachnospiraceae bacterium]
MGWDDVKGSAQSEQSQDKVKYANISEGTSQGRVLDAEPYSRWVHWVQRANNGKGASITCIGSKTCPCCIENSKVDKKNRPYPPRKMHSVNWLNRATGEVEILEKGNGLFIPLQEILQEIGDLRNYDVKIRASGSGKDTTYVPIPMPQKQLTEAEKSLKKYDFSEHYKNPTPEQVMILINGGTYKDAFGSNDVKEEDSNSDDEQVDFTKS